MRTTKWFLFSLVMAAAIITPGCGDSSGDQTGESPVTVTVEKILPMQSGEALRYSGTIEESVSIPLSFSVPGTVKKVLVSEGQHVQKGQVLATLDDASFRNALKIAEATLKQAQDAMARLEPMYKNGTLPEIKMVEVQTSLQQAEASKDISEKNVDDCALRATESALVGRCSIDPGMTVVPGINTITLVQINRVYAKVSVHENEIAKLKKGMKASINIPALGNDDFAGVIEEVGVMADLLSHTYTVKISIDNKDGRIRPGMICNIRIAQEDGSTALVVPAQSVMVDEYGKPFVFTVDPEQKTASRRYITRGGFIQDGIAVTEGIPEGALIVTAGQHKLVDGSPVTFTSAQTGSRGQ